MTRLLSIACFALLVAACDDSAAPPQEAPDNPGLLSDEEAAAQGKHAPIEWDRVEAEAAVPVDAEQGLLQKAGATPGELAGTTLPILVPRNKEFLRRMELKAHSHLYVAMAQFSDYRLRVMGIRAQNPEAPSQREISEDAAEVTFSLWGARYVVKVTCLTPNERRCSEDTLASVITSLIWIGGAE